MKHDVRVHVVNLYTDEVGNQAVPEKLQQAKTTPPAPAAAVSEAKPARRSWSWIAALIIVAALAAVGGFYISSHRSGPKPPTPPTPPMPTAAVAIPEKSIAVLPFVDMSQGHDQEYFCDGISEELLDALAQVEGLRVVARTSSFAFKGKSAEVNEIAQKLNVATVLEGSLRRVGDKIRITAQLIWKHWLSPLVGNL